MERLIVIYIIVISICAYTLPAISTDNVIQKNTSCDIVLNFSSMGLSIINPNFISNPFIKTLALSNNGIDSFQENTFDSLPSLEKLNLSNNELTAENLFSFGNLQQLKSLTLDYNPTTEPFSEECSEDEYKTADGICNYYSELKVKYEYPNLTHLSIRKIFINSLASDWADHFPKLSHLDISENNFCNTARQVFSRLPTSVISLTMQNVQLTALESSNLKNITYLDLDKNRFETLSSHYCYENTLCLRNMTNLESLHVADCSIKRIETDAFKDAKKLNYLNMSSNHFEEIPNGAFEFLPALSHLDLSKNKLHVMPDLSNLQNLSSLYIDDMQNKWSFSTALETFSQLSTLEVLSLRFNGLRQIPSSFLNKLPKLKELNLSHNSIVTLPSWQWQHNLRRLSLGYNKILSLEDISLEEAESLEVLNLEHNTFIEIKIKSLKHLPDKVILKI